MSESPGRPCATGGNGRRSCAEREGACMSGQRPSRLERREFFVDVVGQLVADEGLAAVTMERVAAMAEVSKPVLYKHFEDRGALVTALLDRCWRELDNAVQAKLRDARTLDEQLRAL